MRIKPLSVAHALAALAVLAVTADAQAVLPVPCSPCSSAGGNVPWTSGAGLAPRHLSPQVSNGGRDMLILQGRQRQVYSWQSFDIGPQNSVEFRQPSSSSVALNRVLDPAQRMSVIEGALRANGQVYLINRNGVLFRRGASVDVNTLLASTLDLNQDIEGLFEEIGIGNVLAERITSERAAALVDAPDGLPGNVVVEGGAVIEAGLNGRIVLVGANVENRGVLRLSGPGGQALLVAGEDRVYFFRDEDARGLGVEIGGNGGTVTNVGEIIAGNGNVTLAGLTVNQRGVIRATTAVSANGTIRLQARDRAFGAGAQIPDDVDDLNVQIRNESIATRSGTVTLGSGSVTEILPQSDSADRVVDEQDFLAARVEVRAQDIVMQRNARITVPAGEVELLASDAPQEGNAARIGANPVNAGSITLERGAVIDVAGLREVPLSAARNVLELQLRRAELAGSPVNRDGPLLGSVISFDLRNPPAFIDVSGAIESIGRGILERSTMGGHISLLAGASITLAAGSQLDVSGGSISYASAPGAITRVISGMQVLDLSAVGANTRIDGVLGTSEAAHPRWGYSSFFASPALVGSTLPAYTEGKDAGTIEIASLNLKRNALNATLDQLQIDIALNGRLVAETLRGIYQNEAPVGSATGFARPYDQVPLAGALSLGVQLGDFRMTADALLDDDGNALGHAGVGRFDLDVGSFAVDAGSAIALGGGGALEVTTRTGGIAIGGSVAAPGGRVTLDVRAVDADLVLMPGALLDVAGVWVNDAVRDGPRAAAFIDGGSVALSGVPGGALTLARGSRVDVGGGARLLDGGALVAGAGGALSVDDGITAVSQVLDLALDGSLTGFVFAGAPQGASFLLDVRGVTLAAGARVLSDGERLTLGPDFFTDSGFTDFTLTSSRSAATVERGFDLDLVPGYRLFVPGATASTGQLASGTGAPSGTPLDEVAAVGEVSDPLLRAPTSLTLVATLPGETVASSVANPRDITPAISVAAGARIATDVGGGLRLAANGSIAHAGTLEARGGSVTLDLLNATTGFERGRAIWLLEGSLIDVSGVVLDTSRNPVTRQVARTALDGGSVALRTGVTLAGGAAASGGGFVLAFPGARIDVGGAVGSSDLLVDRGGVLPAAEVVPIASDAGRIDVIGAYGVQFFADVDAAASGALGALGGSLSITLDADRYEDNDTLDPDRVLFPVLSSLALTLDGAARMPALTPLSRLDPAFFGRAAFDLAGYTRAGFESLSLTVRPSSAQFNRVAAAARGLPVMAPSINLVGNLRFDAGGSLELNAPIIASDGGRALLSADYLALGYDDRRFNAIPTDVTNGVGFSASPGSGTAVLKGGFVDVNGLLALRGFGGTNAAGTASSGLFALLSEDDLRFNGMLLPNPNQTDPTQVASRLRTVSGRIDAAGDLLLQGQRIYTSTLTDFTIDNAAGTVHLLDGGLGRGYLRDHLAPLPGAVTSLAGAALGGGSSGSNAIPQSAGGFLHVEADTIHQFARLFAPFGSITLDADTRVVLGSGSLTSVSGLGNTTLFGETVLGDWVFPFSGNDITDFNLVLEPGADDPFVFGLPDRTIRLVADGLDDGGGAAGVVDLQRGAVLDVRGGGELIATEFVQGPIGKVAILDPRLANGSFALVPFGGATLAPVDPLDTPNFEYAIGARFEVLDSGGSGIAKGRYAVLPPRYALLPGAVLLTPEQAGSGEILGRAGSTVSSDGVPLLSGALTRIGQSAVNPLDASQYRVESAGELLERAEYRVTTATEFLPRRARDNDAATPLLPRDAGAVQLLPNLGLNLGATVARGGVPGGIGSRVDISAENVLVASGAGVANPVGAVLLPAAGLRALNADSVLIGGTRRVEGSRIVIDDVTADTVTVGSGVDLSLANLTLVAGDSVRLRAGSTLRGGGGAAAASSTAALSVIGDAAVVRVGTSGLPAFTRLADGGAGGHSSITLEAGARLVASGSLLLDATDAIHLDGVLALADGGDLRLGAPRIGVGEVAPAFDGAALDADIIAGIALGTLELASSDAIRLFGTFDLRAERVRFDAAGLRGEGAAGDRFTVSAADIVFANSSAATLDAVALAGAGSGRLLVRGQSGAPSRLTLAHTAAGAADPGGDTTDFDIFGFATAGALLAALEISVDDVVASADHSLAVAGDLSLTAHHIAPAAGALLDIAATGRVTTIGRDGEAPTAFATLGGAVRLSGTRIDSGSDIIARSGAITLEATGTAAADRLIVRGLLDASGLDREAFGAVAVSSVGGLVKLHALGSGATAADAAITLMPGAAVRVSGGAGDAGQAGGRVALTAPDGALLAAAGSTLQGRAGAGAQGAELVVDVAAVSGGVAALMTALDSEAGAFGGLRDVRVRSGDIRFDGGQTVRAARLRFTADDGSVTVGDALLDASGWWAGEITLNGGSGVALEDGARLRARASGWFAGRAVAVEDGHAGGIVTLAAPHGTVTLGAGSSIDVSGTAANAAGNAALAADTGRVRIIAARSGDAIDIDGGIGTAIAGAGADAIELVANRSYTPATVAAADDDGVALTLAAARLLDALGVGGDARFRLAPGVELVFAGGNLSTSGLGSTLLASLFDADTINAGVLTVRSSGDLSVNQHVRDGLIEELTPEDVTSRIPGFPLPQTRYLIADEKASWTLQLVAGADVSSADLTAVARGAGDFVLGTGFDVVTGSGDITIAAAGDITLNDNANVYIAGRHASLDTYTGTIDDANGVPFNQGFFSGSRTNAEELLPGVSLPDSGGDIHLRAGGNLFAQASGQFVSQWMTRTGMPVGETAADLAALGIAAREVMPGAWGLFYEQVGLAGNPDDRGFNQGIAAFGGGNIRADIGGDIDNAAFSIATAGRQVGNNTFGDANRSEAALAGSSRLRWLDLLDDPDDFSNEVDVLGGGQLRVRAGGAVSGVDLVMFRGDATLVGHDSVSVNRLAAGDAGITVAAASGLTIGGIIDPMLLEVDESGVGNPTRSFVTGRGGLTFETAFFSFGPDAGLDFSTAAGDLRLRNQVSLFDADVSSILNGNILPGEVRFAALSGSLESERRMVLFPGASSTLSLLAGNDIRTIPGSPNQAGYLQSDYDAALLPSRERPGNAPDISLLTLFNNTIPGTFSEPGHARTPVHTGDRVPNSVVAEGGDLVNVAFRLAKRSVIDASGDIRSIDLVIQHPNEGDLSVVEAGRDIRFDVERLPTTGIIQLDTAQPGEPGTNGAKIAVGGPGALQVLAGRTINLGALNGIRSFGDEDNPVLPDLGADLLIFAGLAAEPDYAAFATRFLDPDSRFVTTGERDADDIGTATLERIRRVYGDADVNAEDLALDGATRSRIRAGLVAYLRELARNGEVMLGAGLDPVVQFKTQLTPLQQRSFLLDVLFDELRASSLEAADPASGRLNDFTRGRHAIATLFPADVYDGDVISALSAVQTLDGGDIKLVAPGGTVDAGTTAQTTVTKQPLNLGYVAFRDGAINMYVGESINVNSTRIFTQKGGDITLWADRGNIDAGRGQRDAVTLASTRAVFDEFLNFVDEPPISVSGSGIRTLAPPGVAGGSIFLAAPEGIIDAGDAGIESDSGLVLAAQEVANADFISAGGPTFSTVQVATSVGASLGNLGDVSAAATASVAEATQAAAAAAAEQAAASAAEDAAPAMRVTVDVLGFGG